MISKVANSEKHMDEVSYTAPLKLRGTTLTQFARNMLCVLKALTPKSNFMFQKHFTGYHTKPQIPILGLEFPIDISKVTYFEWLISVYILYDLSSICFFEFIITKIPLIIICLVIMSFLRHDVLRPYLIPYMCPCVDH